MVAFTVYKGSEDGSIIKAETTKDIRPDEVLVEVTHSGLCGTDEHHRKQGIVLGHEGAGVVKEVGSAVNNFKVGESVGWGYQHDCCGHCKQCLKGRETFCSQRHMYGYHDFDQGSFATHAVWKAAFLFHIPEGMDRQDAAPLMCGGATVFNALQLNNIRSTDRVGIIGVGGLGHLAIQMAAKMGCEVVVFSGTESKKEEATKLGATEFYATKGLEKLEINSPIDHLLVTTSAQPDWNLYFPVMAPTGTIYPLGVSNGELKIPYMPLLITGLKVQGSIVAPRNVHNDMLEFAAVHKIKPMIETFPMSVDGITEAFDKLNAGKLRYRAVMVV